jgi:diguanylate cyclase (GGDEF)-like protein/PAS domain S-box-containing protein
VHDVSIFARMDDRAQTQAAGVDSAADVVPLRRGPEELIDDRYLLDALLENTPDHVYFKDSQSRFIRISRALARWLGVTEAAEAIGRSDFDFFGEEHAQKAFADEQRLMRTGEPLVGIEEQETWADGSCTWVSTTKVPLRDLNGTVIGIFGISRDITERKQTEQRVQEQATLLVEQAQTLERLATLDELTGLYNRRGLATVGEQVLYEARLSGTSLGVLFIDLDGLKTINDRYTHRAGDDALRAIASIMQEAAREPGVAARIGGDEFCLLASNATTETVAALADRIDKAVSEHNREAGNPYNVSVSIGRVLVDPRSPGSVDDLVERADCAMYDRKARRVS